MISQLFIYLFILPTVFSINIGLFSGPLNSQQIKNAIQLSNLFVSHQHDVTLIRPSLKCKNIAVSPVEKVHQIFLNVSGLACEKDFKPFTYGKVQTFCQFSDILAENRIFKDTSFQTCKEIINDDNLVREISKRKLDLAVLSDVDYCLLGIIKRAGVPKWILAENGIPSKNVMIENGISSPNQDFMGKALEIFVGTYNYLNEKWFLENTLTELFHQKYHETFPSIATLRHQITAIVSGAQPLLHSDFLFNNKISFINKLVRVEEKKNSQNDVVLVALNDNKILSQSAEVALFDLFRNKKSTQFVWITTKKLDVPSNVEIISYKPSFGNVKLLISDGDYADIIEALHNGIPSLIIGKSSLLDESVQSLEKLEILIVAEDSLIIHYDTTLSAKFLKNVEQLKSILSKQTDNMDLLLEKALTPFKIPNNSSFITTLSIDTAFILFIPLLILFLIARKLLSLYYWSCFEIAYKEKND